MSNLKIKPIIISAVITAAICFGGWALYDQFALQAPLEQVIKEMPGVLSTDKPKRGDDIVSVRLTLSKDADLKKIYDDIAKQGERVIGKKQLQLQIEESESAKLKQIWEKAMFQIAEAMETKTYSTIPALFAAEEKSEYISVETYMDEQNVYITLRDAESALFKVLPRSAQMMGVWPNA